MGIYKRCHHTGRNRDRCAHPWWGNLTYKGRTYRESLAKWSDETVTTKHQAEAIYLRFREAVRTGAVKPPSAQPEAQPLTLNALADLYLAHYVQARNLGSRDTIAYRLQRVRGRLGDRLATDIGVRDIEGFLADLKRRALVSKTHRTPRVRRPATINRYLSLLRHLFNWAVDRDYLRTTPFRRNAVSIVQPEREDNRRHRRIGPDEEEALLRVAPPHLRPLIVFALDTGMRRGEMLALRWVDVDARPHWLRVRGESAKSGKTRWVPVATSRLAALLDFLRLDSDGGRKSAETAVFTDEIGQPMQFPRSAWHATVLQAHGDALQRAAGREGRGRLSEETRRTLQRIDLHWHDLRHEYASRLVERGVPLSQVRDLLGHASIVTTERYDNQKPEALMEAARRLELGKSCTFPAQWAPERPATDVRPSEVNPLDYDDLGDGVDDGTRTRSLRSHSPAL